MEKHYHLRGDWISPDPKTQAVRLGDWDYYFSEREGRPVA